jgi:hypothetical protein
MINDSALIIKNKIEQRGAVVLMTVTLLLLIVTLTTIYTGRSQTFEHQIIVNNQNQKFALISAKAGMQKALAALNVNKQLTNSSLTETLMDKSSFSINAKSNNVTTIWGDRTLYTFSSSGASADGLAAANISEQVLVYPLLVNKPVAPLVVKQGVNALAEIEVVANPNGLSVGQPLSIWSNKEVILGSGTSVTCGLTEFNAGDCVSKFLSNQLSKSNDIQEYSASFPLDLFGYLFNTPIANVIHLKQQATLAAADCSLLNSSSRGLIWITGNCSVSLGEQLGSQSAPLLLVVQDGDLILDKNVTVFGIVFSYRSVVANADLLIKMNSGAIIKGALVTNHQLGQLPDIVRVIYDDAVLQSLVTQKDLQRIARVPGSWKDF